MTKVMARVKEPSTALRLQYGTVLLMVGRYTDLTTLLNDASWQERLTLNEQQSLRALRVGLVMERVERDRTRGDSHSTFRHLRPLLHDYPDEPRVLVALGNLFLDKGDAREAYAVFERRLKAAPTDLEAREGAIRAAAKSAFRATESSGKSTRRAPAFTASASRGSIVVAKSCSVSAGLRASMLGEVNPTAATRSDPRGASPPASTLQSTTGSSSTITAAATPARRAGSSTSESPSPCRPTTRKGRPRGPVNAPNCTIEGAALHTRVNNWALPHWGHTLTSSQPTTTTTAAEASARQGSRHSRTPHSPVPISAHTAET